MAGTFTGLLQYFPKHPTAIKKIIFLRLPLLKGTFLFNQYVYIQTINEKQIAFLTKGESEKKYILDTKFLNTSKHPVK